MSALSQPVLQLDCLTKRYPGVLALDRFSIALDRGEVRALLGKNGAGKSTAIKLLSGAEKPDGGSIAIEGATCRIDGPLDALHHGIATVYQEISLVPALSVAENILLGRWKRSDTVKPLISHAKGKDFAREILQRLKIDVDPDIEVSRLSVAQQLVEIAKAVSYDPRVLVLDEPTSALPQEQVDLLHEVVRTLSGLGTAFIYVTHRLHEIPKIAHNVTVLRDGKLIDTIPVEEATPRKITELMIGRDWQGMSFARRKVAGDPVLSVRNLSTPDKLRNVSFDIREGEVLGLAGLLSAGRTELLRAIFGLDEMTSGQITVAGTPVHRPTPARMKALGVGLTAEDRKRDGLILDFSVLMNATLAPVDRISRHGWLDFPAARALAQDVIGKLDVKTPSMDVPVGALSGGNQQKIVIGNWLNTRPRALLMDEPSRGVDVAAKEQIFKLVRDLAAEGLAVLFVSSEIEEVLDVCDRILVIHEGEITGEYDHDAIDLSTLMARTMNA
ncbi:MAG: sugar ABC transporter ATP-binding protein [Maritimibacter sp.]|nr:sugar ABC transporter ATP-binding protein [Maritimibacter sp.]